MTVKLYDVLLEPKEEPYLNSYKYKKQALNKKYYWEKSIYMCTALHIIVIMSTDGVFSIQIAKLKLWKSIFILLGDGLRRLTSVYYYYYYRIIYNHYFIYINKETCFKYFEKKEQKL